MKFFIFFIFFLTISCTQQEPCPPCPEQKMDMSNDNSIDLKALARERIDLRRIVIGKRLDILATTDELIKEFGRPSKIVVLNEKDSTVEYHFGNTIWQGVVKSMRLSSIDFGSTDIEVQFGDFVVHKNTQTFDLVKQFPLHFRIAPITSSSGISYSLCISTQGSDSKFFFIVGGEHLKKIMFF